MGDGLPHLILTHMHKEEKKQKKWSMEQKEIICKEHNCIKEEKMYY